MGSEKGDGSDANGSSKESKEEKPQSSGFKSYLVSVHFFCDPALVTVINFYHHSVFSTTQTARVWPSMQYLS